jgi:sigma-B regulation protein RsbU (phosphoserine phosphatase)
VLVGDVSGKGVAAALLMSSLLATVRGLFSVGLPAGDLLARVNALFHDTTASSSFATLAAASLHPDGRVDLYSAGHWPPVVLHRRKLDPVTITPGVPIGLFSDSRYAPTRLQLDPGDTLLFYTDGVIDAENGAGEDYSRRRLAEALTSANGHHLDGMVTHVLADWAAFQNGRRADDDVMLFGVRRV